MLFCGICNYLYMVEYPFHVLVALCGMVLERIEQENLTSEQIEALYIRLYPVSVDGTISFDVGAF